MNTSEYDVPLFWRAVIGALFGMVVGGVWLTKGFLAALLMLIFIVVGALVGFFATGHGE